MTSKNPSLQRARLHVVFEIAKDALLLHGEANPGAIIRNLSLGPFLSSEDELATAAREHGWLFMNDDYDHGALYELALNRLERELGPLTCIPDAEVCGEQADTWGYANIISDSSMRAVNLTREQHSELWAHRIVALGTGHPDHAWYHDEEEAPHNVWRRGTVPAEAAPSQSS